MLDQQPRVLTFLFTDIEGSTRRWQEDPGTMGALVEAHDDLMGRLITDHQGKLVKQTGDGVFAVFDDPYRAVQTATEAQRMLAEGQDADPLRVRMGIHSGTAVPRHDDYFGSEVNRAARLMGAAQGGQVVLSSVTASLVGETLDDGVTLISLGTHRLRDLSEPIGIYQLVAPGLATDFPALSSLDGFPNNLPADVSSFVGRTEDISSVMGLLDTHRLTCLTGAGGSGKTRLALQVAAEILPQFADGAWFVDLAGLAEPELVPLSIATTLRLPEKAGRSWIDVLTEYVTTRTLLIVLDNCEHLLDIAAEVSSQLLSFAPGLKLLTTTREPLNVPGEVAWRVPPLDLPDDDSASDLEDILGYEAVQLFVERALAARPDLELTDDDVPAIAEVCRRLDGLPLALELAAARVRALSVRDIADHLGDRFSLLSGGSRTALPRHRTLEGAVAWSYELLNVEEQKIFRQLSVFSGGFELNGALVVAGPDSLNGVASLADKSLLSVRTSQTGTRYRMLETVAAFAHQRLGEGFADARNAHLQWAAMFAGSAAQELDGKDQAEWLDRVTNDLDNFRAAMQWALDGGDPALGMIIAGSLYRFWYIRGVREGRRWLDLFLDADAVVTPELKARALFATGSLHQSMGDYDVAATLLEESSRMSKDLGERRLGAYALHYLIRSVWGTTDPDEMRDLIDRNLEEFRAVEEPVGIVLTLLFDVLWHLSYGSVDDIETIDELITTAEAIGAPQLLAHADEIPAVAAWFRGDVDEAAPLLARAAGIYIQIRNQQCAAHCLENSAGWAMRSGSAIDASVLLGASKALRDDSGIPTPQYESLIYDTIFNEIKTELAEDFTPAWEKGQAMSMDDALEFVIEITERDE